MAKIALHELVKTVEAEVLPAAEGPAFTFRLEVFAHADGQRFFPRLWRLEHLRVQPSFPQKDGRPSLDDADEEILVRDSTISQDWTKPTVAEVVNTIFGEIGDRFGR